MGRNREEWRWIGDLSERDVWVATERFQVHAEAASAYRTSKFFDLIEIIYIVYQLVIQSQ
jgi:hypothetical protein